jgi:very-short-patch-repair endonuclease
MRTSSTTPKGDGRRIASHNRSRSFNRRLYEHLATHDEVVSRQQLVGLGLTADGIDSRVEAGHLDVVHPGVYKRAGIRLTERGRWRAALLACGEGAHLGAETAAAVIGMHRTSRLYVIVPPGRNVKVPGIEVHRCIVEEADSAETDGLRHTAWPRTVLDCGTVVGSRTLRRMLDRLVEPLQVYDVHAIDDLLERHPRRAGRKALRAALGFTTDRGDRSRSDEELLLDEALQALGEVHQLVNEPLGPYIPDFRFVPERLVVEVDGGQHRAPFQRLYDEERDAWMLARHGLTTHRIPAASVRKDPKAAASEVLRLLRARRSKDRLP